MNLQKLKGKIVEKGKNYTECAEVINKSKQSFSDKINGKRKFYIDEVNALGIFLDLSAEEKAEIFL